MSRGRFIAVVGPSGVGKDSVMEGLVAARPDLTRVRRVITRPSEAGGEAFDGIDETGFARMRAAGMFALDWQAHGLSYGIPATVHEVLADGRDALANLSRGVVSQAMEVFGPTHVHVLAVTARPEILAGRLAGRGRESAAEIAARLARAAPLMPLGVRVTEIDNSGALEGSIAAALTALYPERV